MPRTDHISKVLLDQRKLEDEAAPLIRPYTQGFADARGSGTRRGPVHLFSSGNEFTAVTLCGTKSKLWNFEGETKFDFCPRCLAAAKRLQSPEITQTHPAP